MHASIGTFGLLHGLGLILTRADEVATETAAGEGRGGGSVPAHSRDQAGAQARTGVYSLTRVQRRPRSLPQMVRTTPGGAEGPGGRYQFIQLRGKGSGHGAMEIGTD